jgi:Ca-activated chloride channel family protein
MADSWTGQHRPRSQFWRWILAVVIVLILLGAAGVGTVLLQRSSSPLATHGPATKASSAPSCPDASVHVAAAPEIAPVIEAAARTLAPPGAVCGPVAVTAVEPAAVASATKRPDVWIPSSSAWLKMAGKAYTTKGDPIAWSPIVIAGPAPIAGQFITDGKTSWAALTAGAAAHQLPVSMADPQQNTVGLLSVYAENVAMARTTSDAGIAELQALTLRSRLEDSAADPAQKLSQLATETNVSDAAYDAGIFPLTEQQLRTYQQAKHTVSLTGAAPVDAPVEADYPWATIKKPGSKAAVISKLRAAVTKAALAKAGFRTAPSDGALPLPAKIEDLLGPAKLWVQYRTLNFQVLLLIDTSGSMNLPVKDKAGHTTTKAALLRQSGATAAQLFGEDTSLGLWLFGTPTASSPAHQEVIPLGPLASPLGDNGKTRRDALVAAMGQYKAVNNAGTPLYQSVLDGEAAMQKEAKPGTVTLVIVLTDGDDGESKYAMSQATFMKKLAAQRDPQRPVPIIGVGYGPTADMKALTAMAQATGGQAISATDPANLASAMAQAFLAAHLQQ